MPKRSVTYEDYLGIVKRLERLEENIGAKTAPVISSDRNEYSKTAAEMTVSPSNFKKLESLADGDEVVIYCTDNREFALHMIKGKFVEKTTRKQEFNNPGNRTQRKRIPRKRKQNMTKWNAGSDKKVYK